MVECVRRESSYSQGVSGKSGGEVVRLGSEVGLEIVHHAFMVSIEL